VGKKRASLSPAQFETLRQEIWSPRAAGRDLFVQDLFAGADPAHRIGVRVVTELAWRSLFIPHLLIEPNDDDRAKFAAEFARSSTRQALVPILPAMALRSATVIAIDFSRKIVLIAGTS